MTVRAGFRKGTLSANSAYSDLQKLPQRARVESDGHSELLLNEDRENSNKPSEDGNLGQLAGRVTRRGSKGHPCGTAVAQRRSGAPGLARRGV